MTGQATGSLSLPDMTRTPTGYSHPWILLVATLLLTGACGREDVCTEISSRRAQEMIDKYPSLHILDLRTGAEYYREHIPGAVLADITDTPAFDRILQDYRRDQPVILYDRSGGVSACKACERMEEAGFRSVYILAGGFQAWPKPE